MDKQNDIHKNSSSHTYGNCEEDVKDMIDTLRKLKPFQFTVDRYHRSFQTIDKSPLDKLDAVLLHKWLTRHKVLLASNQYANVKKPRRRAMTVILMKTKFIYRQ